MKLKGQYLYKVKTIILNLTKHQKKSLKKMFPSNGKAIERFVHFASRNIPTKRLAKS